MQSVSFISWVCQNKLMKDDCIHSAGICEGHNENKEANDEYDFTSTLYDGGQWPRIEMFSNNASNAETGDFKFSYKWNQFQVPEVEGYRFLVVNANIPSSR